MFPKVLLVDDEADFLEIMAERLELRDISVSTADSVLEALERLESQDFDAVVMDFLMPDMDGISALKALKKAKPELHVFLLTGYATLEKRKEALASGADALLDKPGNLNLLARKIRKVSSQTKGSQKK